MDQNTEMLVLWRCTEEVRAIRMPSWELFETIKEIMEKGGPPAEDPFYSEVPEWAQDVAKSLGEWETNWAVVSEPIQQSPRMTDDDLVFLRELSEKFVPVDATDSRTLRIEQWFERSMEQFEEELLSLRFDHQDARHSLYHYVTGIMLQHMFRDKIAELEGKPQTPAEPIVFPISGSTEADKSIVHADPLAVRDTDELVMVVGKAFCGPEHQDFSPMFARMTQELIQSSWGVPIQLKVIFEVDRSESHTKYAFTDHVAAPDELLVIWQGCLVKVLKLEDKTADQFIPLDGLLTVLARHLSEWFHLGHLREMLRTSAASEGLLAESGWSEQRLYLILVDLLRTGLTLRNFERIVQVVARHAPDTKDSVIVASLRKSLLPLAFRRHSNRFEIQAVEIDPEFELQILQEIECRESTDSLAEKVKHVPNWVVTNTLLLVHHSELVRPLSYALPQFSIFTEDEIPKGHRLKIVASYRPPL
jgi:hypothetical protein